MSAMSWPSAMSGYRIGRTYGSGAFSTVVEASVDDQVVALKIIDKQQISALNLNERLAHELSIHRSVSHPHICPLLHSFEDGERAVLVLPLYRLGDARQLILNLQRADTPPVGLDENSARQLISDLVSALTYLHQHRIVHRDLKLANVLLYQEQTNAELESDSTTQSPTHSLPPKPRLRAVLCDFGLATRLERDDDSASHTMCGTPNFVAPEILSREGHGPAADRWALGCCAYTLLVGRPPFESDSVQQTLDKVKNVDFAVPSTLSAAAADFITNLLQRDPAQRLTLSQMSAHPFLSPAIPFHLLTHLRQPLRLSFDRISVDSAHSPVAITTSQRYAAISTASNSVASSMDMNSDPKRTLFPFAASVSSSVALSSSRQSQVDESEVESESRFVLRSPASVQRFSSASVHDKPSRSDQVASVQYSIPRIRDIDLSRISSVGHSFVASSVQLPISNQISASSSVRTSMQSLPSNSLAPSVRSSVEHLPIQSAESSHISSHVASSFHSSANSTICHPASELMASPSKATQPCSTAVPALPTQTVESSLRTSVGSPRSTATLIDSITPLNRSLDALRVSQLTQLTAVSTDDDLPRLCTDRIEPLVIPMKDGSNVSVLLNGDVVYADVRRRTSLHIHINATPQSATWIVQHDDGTSTIVQFDDITNQTLPATVRAQLRRVSTLVERCRARNTRISVGFEGERVSGVCMWMDNSSDWRFELCLPCSSSEPLKLCFVLRAAIDATRLYLVQASKSTRIFLNAADQCWTAAQLSALPWISFDQSSIPLDANSASSECARLLRLFGVSPVQLCFFLSQLQSLARSQRPTALPWHTKVDASQSLVEPRWQAASGSDVLAAFSADVGRISSTVAPVPVMVTSLASLADNSVEYHEPLQLDDVLEF